MKGGRLFSSEGIWREMSVDDQRNENAKILEIVRGQPFFMDRFRSHPLLSDLSFQYHLPSLTFPSHRFQRSFEMCIALNCCVYLDANCRKFSISFHMFLFVIDSLFCCFF